MHALEAHRPRPQPHYDALPRLRPRFEKQAAEAVPYAALEEDKENTPYKSVILRILHGESGC